MLTKTNLRKTEVKHHQYRTSLTVKKTLFATLLANINYKVTQFSFNTLNVINSKTLKVTHITKKQP